MTDAARRARYARIADQLAGLFETNDEPVARMATIAALLHHKFNHHFWTGFYRLLDGKLVVGPYQGPLACAVLEPPEGVCWAGVQRGGTVSVPDVEAFPGHVACDARSKSEIVVPVRDASGGIVAVLDVDSAEPDQFGEVDREGLERICGMIYG